MTNLPKLFIKKWHRFPICSHSWGLENRKQNNIHFDYKFRSIRPWRERVQRRIRKVVTDCGVSGSRGCVARGLLVRKDAMEFMWFVPVFVVVLSLGFDQARYIIVFAVVTVGCWLCSRALVLIPFAIRSCKGITSQSLLFLSFDLVLYVYLVTLNNKDTWNHRNNSHQITFSKTCSIRSFTLFSTHIYLFCFVLFSILYTCDNQIWCARLYNYTNEAFVT